MLVQHIVSRMELSEQQLDRRFEQFAPADGATSALIADIGREFAKGYNDTLRSFDPSSIRPYVEAQADDYLTPFYVEGASMAFAAGRVLHPAKARTAHQQLLAELPQHKYLIYAGRGWWYTVRPAGATGLRRSRLWSARDLFSSLAIDGMAFGACFLRAAPPDYDLDCPFRDRDQRRVWLQGYGRALWFVAGGRPEALRRQCERLDADLGSELHAGIGLATAFAGLRKLTSLPSAPSRDEHERRAYYQGLAFGLTARRQASPRSWEQFIDQVDGPAARWASDVTDLCSEPPGHLGTDAVAAYTAWQSRLRHEVLIDEMVA